MIAASSNGNGRRGRPPKFGRPSRAVTLTLPEDVLARLGGVDRDLGRAIVRLVERRAPAIRPGSTRGAELSRYGRHAVILVTPVRALRRLPGVELVPIGNGQCLISLDDRHSIPQLELHVRDAIERGQVNGRELAALQAIADILRHSRATRGRSLQERTIIVLEAPRRRARP